MSVQLKTQADGKTLRECWYGIYRDSAGKRRVVNLNVKWAGSPPESGSLRDAGDAKFERSRERAEQALAAFVEESRHKGRAETLTERLIESKTGRAVEYVKIEDLPERWRALGRDASVSEMYLRGCDAQFRRFAEFMRQQNPKAAHLYEVTPADAAAFIQACQAALAPSTATDARKLLSKAFEKFLPVGTVNPFSTFIRKRSNGDSGVVHRAPFTPVELARLLVAAQTDPFMHPLIVCAAMTGMRRGDVCNLRWESVDMAGNMITVKTSKTGGKAEIPIFPPLRAVLEASGGKGKGFVWPEAAAMLAANPDGLTWRFKKIVAASFTQDGTHLLPSLTPAADVESEGLAAIHEKVRPGARRDRMVEVLTRYCAGQSVRQIERELGVARANVSTDLHHVETWTGKRFVGAGIKSAGIKSAVARLTRIDRANGQRAASVRDWHALRTTWVTIALRSGVPMEVLRRVTGHQTVEVVLKNYDQRDREDFRAVLSGALPAVLTGGTPKGKRTRKPTAADELAGLVGKVQAGTATAADKKRIALLAAKV